MKNKIKEVIDNRTAEGEITRCEKVLGDRTRVYAIADIWGSSADLIELIAVNGLIDYVENETFTHEEFAAFKKGVAYMGEFMGKCKQERDALEKEELKVATRGH